MAKLTVAFVISRMRLKRGIQPLSMVEVPTHNQLINFIHQLANSTACMNQSCLNQASIPAADNSQGQSQSKSSGLRTDLNRFLKTIYVTLLD